MEEKLSFSFRKRQITGCTKISHCEEKPPLLLLVFISRELLELVFNYVATIIVIDAKKESDIVHCFLKKHSPIFIRNSQF